MHDPSWWAKTTAQLVVGVVSVAHVVTHIGFAVVCVCADVVVDVLAGVEGRVDGVDWHSEQPWRRGPLVCTRHRSGAVTAAQVGAAAAGAGYVSSAR